MGENDQTSFSNYAQPSLAATKTLTAPHEVIVVDDNDDDDKNEDVRFSKQIVIKRSLDDGEVHDASAKYPKCNKSNESIGTVMQSQQEERNIKFFEEETNDIERIYGNDSHLSSGQSS